MAGTAACAAVWLLAMRAEVGALDRRFGPWALWLAWLGLSLLAGGQPAKGVYPLSVWLGLTAFLLTAASLWGERERRAWVGVLVVSSLILMAGSVLIRGPAAAWTGFMPPYYNRNAFVMAAVFGAALGALWHRDGAAGPPASGAEPVPGWERKALGAAAVLAVAWLLAAHSRGGLMAAARTAAVWCLRAGRARTLAYGLVACAALAAAAALNPHNALARGHAARLQWESGRPDKALALLDEAIRLEPNFFSARMLRVEIRAKAGKTRIARWECAEIARMRGRISASQLHSGYDAAVTGFDAGRHEVLCSALDALPAAR